MSGYKGPEISIGVVRKDGKIPTRLTYGPNHSFNKLFTQQHIDNWLSAFPKIKPTYTGRKTF